MVKQNSLGGVLEIIGVFSLFWF